MHRQLIWSPIFPIIIALLIGVGTATMAEELGQVPGKQPLLPSSDRRALERIDTKGAGYCLSGGNISPTNLPAYNWQDNFIALTRLGNHWMPSFGDGDSMTSPFWHDKGASPPFGSDGLRETWYISRDNLAGTAPMNRLFGAGNHVDSPLTSEGPYIPDLGLPHGYPWTAAGAGLLPMRRYYNSSITDHRTWLFDQAPAGYTPGATYWANSAHPSFGYQRFGNKIDRCGVLADAYGTWELSNSTFKIDFNKIWGGAIGRILYEPLNKQLVSESIGDMVQSTLFRPTAADPPGFCCVYNPTESGGADVTNFGNTPRWTGSPMLSAIYSRTTPRSFIRLLRPLNFDTNAFQGTDPWSPLLWRGEFRKTTTLGQVLGGTLYDDVIRIHFETKLDSDAPVAMDGVYHMNNTFWLRMNQFGDGEVNDFDLELFDITLNTSSAISYPADWRQDVVLTNQNDKAILIIDAPGTFAVGMFRPGLNWVHKILYWCSSTAPDQGLPCPSVHQLFVIDFFNLHTLSRTVWESEPVYFVAGTPETVRQRMRQIAKEL